nr:RSS protein [Mercurialis latent virus]
MVRRFVFGKMNLIVLLIVSFHAINVRADLMTGSTVPNVDVLPTLQERPPPGSTGVNSERIVKKIPQSSPNEREEIKLNPNEEVKISAPVEPEPLISTSPTLQEMGDPARESLRCVDCAVKHLPESDFSVKIPKLRINFEVKEFPSSRLLISKLASSLRRIPILTNINHQSDDFRLQLKSLGEFEVFISIPKFGWSQTLKLSDVISGLDFPKIPTLGPKLVSCVGECKDVK